MDNSVNRTPVDTVNYLTPSAAKDTDTSFGFSTENSPERRSIRKNPKPIKNRGSGRMLENGAESDDYEYEPPHKSKKQNDLMAKPPGADVNKSRQGKRARKPVIDTEFVSFSPDEENINARNPRVPVSHSENKLQRYSSDGSTAIGIKQTENKASLPAKKIRVPNRKTDVPAVIQYNGKTLQGGIVRSAPFSASVGTQMTNMNGFSSSGRLSASHIQVVERDVDKLKRPNLSQRRSSINFSSSSASIYNSCEEINRANLTSKVSVNTLNSETDSTELTIVDLNSAGEEEEELTIIDLDDNGCILNVSVKEDSPSSMEIVQPVINDNVDDMVVISDDEQPAKSQKAKSVTAGSDACDPEQKSNLERLLTNHSIPDVCSSIQKSDLQLLTDKKPPDTKSASRSTGIKRRPKCAARRQKRGAANAEDEEYSINSKVVQRLSKSYGGRAKNGQTQRRKSDKTGRGGCKTEKDTALSIVGPVVHIVGMRTNPASCRVVNNIAKDSDSSTMPRKHCTFPTDSFCHAPSVKFLDTAPWLCIFCGWGSTYRYLGDLFGPYYSSDHNTAINGKPTQSRADNIRGPVVSQNPTLMPSVVLDTFGDRAYQRWKIANAEKLQMNTSNSAAVPLKPSICGEDVVPQEMWVHMECALWTNGVHIANGRLKGLEESVAIAKKTHGGSHCGALLIFNLPKAGGGQRVLMLSVSSERILKTCSHCGRVGATLGCYIKGCSLAYHYLCAVQSDCVLREDNFTVFCSKHKGREARLAT